MVLWTPVPGAVPPSRRRHLEVALSPSGDHPRIGRPYLLGQNWSRSPAAGHCHHFLAVVHRASQLMTRYRGSLSPWSAGVWTNSEGPPFSGAMSASATPPRQLMSMNAWQPRMFRQASGVQAVARRWRPSVRRVVKHRLSVRWRPGSGKPIHPCALAGSSLCRKHPSGQPGGCLRLPAVRRRWIPSSTPGSRASHDQRARSASRACRITRHGEYVCRTDPN